MSFVIRDDGAKVEVHHNTKGAINEIIATAWLMKNGYEVFRNQSPRGRADMVITKWDDDGWIAVDVKSEGFDLDGATRMNESQREAAEMYRESNLRYLVVNDMGNCFWYDELKNNEDVQKNTHWVDPLTGQRFLHPRNDLNKNEWAFFSHWVIRHHADKVNPSLIGFLQSISKSDRGRGHNLTKKDREWLKKIHRIVYKKITGLCPDTGAQITSAPVAANDNIETSKAAA